MCKRKVVCVTISWTLLVSFLTFLCTWEAYLSGNIRQQQIPVRTEPLYVCLLWNMKITSTKQLPAFSQHMQLRLRFGLEQVKLWFAHSFLEPLHSYHNQFCGWGDNLWRYFVWVKRCWSRPHSCSNVPACAVVFGFTGILKPNWNGHSNKWLW